MKEKAKIFLSICVGDKPELQFIATLQNAMANTQHKIVPYYEEKCSGLTWLRNRHVNIFLRDYPDCTHYASLDADLRIYNCAKGDNLFDKLVAWDKDFVGGLYSKRLERPAPFRWASMPKTLKMEYDTGLIEMEWLSGGCQLIKRAALERIAAAHPELKYESEDGEGVAIMTPFIHTLPDGTHKQLSEDWAICQRHKDLSGKVWADTTILLGHIGCKEYMLWPNPLPRHLGGHGGVTHTDWGALRYIKERFSVKTMLDIGCGPGGMKEIAEWLGVEWAGVDGDPRIKPPVLWDFTRKKYADEAQYDLAWCVEFVEHIDEKYIGNYMPALECCKVVVLTHAKPGQDGYHHVNCQDDEYWKKQLLACDFVFMAEETEQLRKASLMQREFMRETGMVFARRDSAVARSGGAK